MSPDRAAELLQIPERGLDLLQRFNEDETIRKALQAVEAGFAPQDVAEMYGLPFNASEILLDDEDVPSEGSIHVYECQTRQCRQKGRVATSTVAPDEADEDAAKAALVSCPSCGRRMILVKSVESEWDLGDLRRTRSPKASFHDSMHGVDRAGSTDRGIDDD
jgi:hypothetical protein